MRGARAPARPSTEPICNIAFTTQSVPATSPSATSRDPGCKLNEKAPGEGVWRVWPAPHQDETLHCSHTQQTPWSVFQDGRGTTLSIIIDSHCTPHTHGPQPDHTRGVFFSLLSDRLHPLFLGRCVARMMCQAGLPLAQRCGRTRQVSPAQGLSGCGEILCFGASRFAAGRRKASTPRSRRTVRHRTHTYHHDGCFITPQGAHSGIDTVYTG